MEVKLKKQDRLEVSLISFLVFLLTIFPSIQMRSPVDCWSGCLSARGFPIPYLVFHNDVISGPSTNVKVANLFVDLGFFILVSTFFSWATLSFKKHLSLKLRYYLRKILFLLAILGGLIILVSLGILILQ